ncbi:hypothetical protein BBJ29_001048 [Phytophthora kernoviae]|uniref:CCHC-type domain-containing protein n=1 Tax=Phytophthora kernoviae TaxID=325452 RepID=A0A3F2RVT1_9STRA|nr:hypothetical protein BBJ29_001048 [Phytophthora kernoviae]RLN65176.1 hypothetical protein BBP00_00003006 [Phytophthora kernoviae]
MLGENAGVLDAMSDVSTSEDSDEEFMHVMDPSDPRAHRPQLSVQPTRSKSIEKPNQKRKMATSRWDSDDPEDVGQPIIVYSDSEPEQDHPQVEEQPPKPRVTLSKWAQARFLVPASERKLPVLEEPPLEPLNDFILSDFGSRYRGVAGDVEVEKEVKEEEEKQQEKKIQVGVPLFDSSGGNGDLDGEKAEEKDKKDKKNKKEADGRKRKENRYFVTDLAMKCFNCGQIGHMANVCVNDKLQQPCYYCALRGHMAWECTNLPCSNCMQLGHQEQNCENRTLDLEPCSICGRSDHVDEDCENVGNQQLSCMPIPASMAKSFAHITLSTDRED